MKRFRTPVFFRWIFHRRIWGFSSNDKVCLTFDDGPTPELTSWILDTLDEYGVKATFFCVGSNVKEHPEIYSGILERGHQVGNHTMRHERGTKTDADIYLNSINEAAAFIDSDLFRPPYGRVPMTRTRKIRKNYKIVMWSWLSYDFDNDVTVEEILESAKNDIKAGDILVVHDNEKVTDRIKQLLPELIKIVKDKGLGFSVISA